MSNQFNLTVFEFNIEKNGKTQNILVLKKRGARRSLRGVFNEHMGPFGDTMTEMNLVHPVNELYSNSNLDSAKSLDGYTVKRGHVSVQNEYYPDLKNEPKSRKMLEFKD